MKRIESAKKLVDDIGGFRGNGPEELGVVACAQALIAIAEDVREIREIAQRQDHRERREGRRA